MTGAPPPRPTLAFELSQLGTVAARRFAELLREEDLTPPEAGALRLIARSEGISQRELARRLGAAPSRVVALVDALEEHRLVVRRRSASDRRNHELHLTTGGKACLRRLRTIAEHHEDDVVGALSERERDQLARLLGKLRAAHGLDAEVHPGYRPDREGRLPSDLL